MRGSLPRDVVESSAAAQRCIGDVNWRGLSFLRHERDAYPAVADVFIAVLLLLDHVSPTWETARHVLADHRTFMRRLKEFKPSRLPSHTRRQVLGIVKDDTEVEEDIEALRAWATNMCRACCALESAQNSETRRSMSPAATRKAGTAQQQQHARGGHGTASPYAPQVRRFKVLPQEIHSGSVYPFEGVLSEAIEGVLGPCSGGAGGSAAVAACGGRDGFCVITGSHSWELLSASLNNICEKVFQVLLEAHPEMFLVAHDVTDQRSQQLLPPPSLPALRGASNGGVQLARVGSTRDAVKFMSSARAAHTQKKLSGSVVITVTPSSVIFFPRCVRAHRTPADAAAGCFHFVLLSSEKNSRNSVAAFRRGFQQRADIRVGGGYAAGASSSAPRSHSPKTVQSGMTSLLSLFAPGRAASPCLFLETPLVTHPVAGVPHPPAPGGYTASPQQQQQGCAQRSVSSPLLRAGRGGGGGGSPVGVPSGEAVAAVAADPQRQRGGSGTPLASEVGESRFGGGGNSPSPRRPVNFQLFGGDDSCAGDNSLGSVGTPTTDTLTPERDAITPPCGPPCLSGGGGGSGGGGAALSSLLRRKRVLKRLTCSDSFPEAARCILEAFAILVGVQTGSGWDAMRRLFCDPLIAQCAAELFDAPGGAAVAARGGGRAVSAQGRRRLRQLAEHRVFAAEGGGLDADEEFDLLLALLREAVLRAFAQTPVLETGSRSCSRGGSVPPGGAGLLQHRPDRRSTSGDSSLIRAQTWRAFAERAAKDGLVEQDLYDVSLETLQGLMQVYGVIYPVHTAHVELTWKEGNGVKD